MSIQSRASISRLVTNYLRRLGMFEPPPEDLPGLWFPIKHIDGDGKNNYMGCFLYRTDHYKCSQAVEQEFLVLQFTHWDNPTTTAAICIDRSVNLTIGQSSVAVLLFQVNQHSINYHALGSQCDWFGHTVFKSLQTLFGQEGEKEVFESDTRGRFGPIPQTMKVVEARRSLRLEEYNKLVEQGRADWQQTRADWQHEIDERDRQIDERDCQLAKMQAELELLKAQRAVLNDTAESPSPSS
ncbi:hypothetical protein C8R48DRAFT_758567 [Suillus tomentosus]|nr:hypothetical protein C8R48DRAFT_758567 [Suillus tomentosus]